MRLTALSGKEKWRDRGFAALFVIGLWVILAICFDFYYDLNDDSAMKDILSGAYTGTPDGHTIQMLYPLGWLVSLFYRLVPAIPWYGIFLCGSQFLALWIVVCSVSASLRSKTGKLTAQCLVTAAAGILFLYEWVFVQYTVTAGLLACGALVRLCMGPSPGEARFYRYHIVTVCLIVLAFFLRTEMLLLLCPFLALAAFLRVADQWKADQTEKKTAVGKAAIQTVKGYALLAVATGILMTAGLVADKAAYGSAQWNVFRQFFDDRTRVYDFYGIPAYEEHRAFYDSIGLSEAQYTLLDNYNFDLDDAIDAGMMYEIAEYAASHQGMGIFRRLYESVYAYGYRFLHGEELIFDLFAVVSYFFLIRAALATKNRLLLGKITLLFGLRSALWLFLLYRGRMVARVTHPLYLMELTMLGFYFLSGAAVFQWKKLEKSAILSLYVILLLCTAFSQVQTVRGQYAQREAVNVQWQSWKQYCRKRPENYYYLDVYSSVAYSEKMFSDTGPGYRNFDLAGGWCVKSPLAAKKREQAGLESAQSALLAGNAFFVADHTKPERSPDFLLAFYRQKGTEIVIEETDRCGCFTVFQIVGAAAKQ